MGTLTDTPSASFTTTLCAAWILLDTARDGAPDLDSYKAIAAAMFLLAQDVQRLTGMTIRDAAAALGAK